MWVTGAYQLNFYNKYGQRLRDLTTSARCYTEGVAAGEAGLANGAETGAVSFTLDHRVYNSLDDHPNWECKKCT